MPCDTTQSSTVKFNMEATDYALLTKAMQVLGFAAPQVSSTGVLTFWRGSDVAVFNKGKVRLSFNSSNTTETEAMNQIRRAYSTEVVKATAVRMGWRLKVKGQGKFEVEKS